MPRTREVGRDKVEAARPSQRARPRAIAMSRRCTVLVAAFALGYLACLGLRPLAVPDEGRYAEIAREILARGDWVRLRLLDLPYFEKPVGGYWLNALSIRALGANNFALRLPAALCSGLTAWILAALVRNGTSDARKGAAAACVFLFSFLPYQIGTHALLDPPLTLGVVAALACAWGARQSRDDRGRFLCWAGVGAACAAAFLVKGFVALALPGMVLVAFFLWSARPPRWLAGTAVAAGVCAALVAPWAWAVQLRDPDFWSFFFWNEHVRRFAGRDAQHARPFLYYVPILAAMTVPWTALAWGALRETWRGARTGDDFARFLLAALFVPFLFFSAARGKLATYVLPCWAAFAALIGCAAIERWDERAVRGFRAAGWWNAGLALAAAAALIAMQLGTRDAPYGPGEGAALAALGAFLASWAALGWAVARGRCSPFLAFPAMVLVLAVAAPTLLPRRVLEDTLPQALLERARPLAADALQVACTDVALAPAVAWTLERSDLVLLGDRGELEYGLATSAGAGRFVALEEAAAWIEAGRAAGPVAVFLRSKPERLERTLASLPRADRSVRGRAFAALRYERRPADSEALPSSEGHASRLSGRTDRPGPVEPER